MVSWRTGPTGGAAALKSGNQRGKARRVEIASMKARRPDQFRKRASRNNDVEPNRPRHASTLPRGPSAGCVKDFYPLFPLTNRPLDSFP